MKKTTIALICSILIVSVSFTNRVLVLRNDKMDFKGTSGVFKKSDKIDEEEQNSTVPDALTKGVWTIVSSNGVIEKRFYNIGNKGYMQLNGLRNSLGVRIETTAEGTVKFLRDKYTFYPFKGQIISVYSSGNKTKRPYTTIMTKLWELRRVQGKVYLYEYSENDINRKDPIAYQNTIR